MTQTPPLPDLRIVPVDSITPHEALDKQRSMPLVEALQRDGFIGNPIIVVEDPKRPGHYVLLDGTNRLNALSTLHIPNVLAQVVDYNSPHVELHTWNHILTNVSSSDLLGEFTKIKNLNINSTKANGKSLGHIWLDDKTVYGLVGPDDTLRSRAGLLRQVVETSINCANLFRTTVDMPSQVRDSYPNFSALVAYAGFQPEDVLQLAREGLQAPAGVTRHVIHGRALRINYPLELLRTSQLDLANEQLKEWMQIRYTSRRVRFYGEAIYLFDE